MLPVRSSAFQSETLASFVRTELFLPFQFERLPTWNITYIWQGRKKLHTHALTQSRLNTQMLEVFTRTSWAAETLLHTNPFPHRSFHTEKPYTRVCFAHRQSSCTEASTQRSRCTGQLWHNDVFTHKSFYTEEPFVAQRKTCISPPLGCPTHTIAAERRTCTTTFAFHRAFAKLPQPPQEEGQHCRCLVRFCFFSAAPRSWSTRWYVVHDVGDVDDVHDVGGVNNVVDGCRWWWWWW